MNLSIILINYNNYQDTIECIDSLLKNRIHISEIIVVENGSTNDSYSILKNKYSEIYIIKLNENIGFSGGNNIGIKEAIKQNKEFVILLNNDTIIENNAIEILIKEFKKNENYSLASGRIFYYPDKNKIWFDGGHLNYWRGLAVHNNYNKNFNEVDLINHNNEVDFISGCYMAIRLSDINKLGLLEEKYFLYLEDIDYCAKAIKKGLKLLYVPQSVIYHKSNGQRKLNESMVYYSTRNRNLLINNCFDIRAKLFFYFIIRIKIVFWFLTRNQLYKVAIKAIKDYKSDKFGKYNKENL